jgi:hypothetical protein
MNMFYVIEPEVVGDLGDGSVLDYSTKPPTVLELHCEFNVWLGDDLATIHPCYIVSERLRSALSNFAGTGYRFEDVEISIVEGFDVLNPHIELPRFHWLQVHGAPGVDDAGLTPSQTRLVVSDRLLSVLRTCVIDHCIVRRKPFRATGTS